MAGDLLERILDKIEPEPNSGCWIWVGATNSDGYAHIKVDGKVRSVHRVIYELMVGPIPTEHDVDHECRLRPCVNFGHLEPVTTQENVLRSHHPNMLTATRGVCRRGHAMTPDNIYASSGGRQCRTCVLANRLRRKEPVHE